MKKILFFVACCFAVLTFDSCLDSDGNSASAERDYGATYDSIVFADVADTVFYDALDSALKTMNIISAPGKVIVISEKVEIDYNSTSIAIEICNGQAVDHYRKKVDSLSRAQLIQTAKNLNLPIQGNMPFDSLGQFSTNFKLFYQGEAFKTVYLDSYSKTF